MKGFSLTPQQIQELRSAYKSALKSKDGKLAYKINAVILLGSGWTIEEVVETLLLDDETLRTYIKSYLSDGILALMKKSQRQ